MTGNTVYKNVTAGINVEGTSTGRRSRTTSASTTGSRARARTATSASTRLDRGTTLDYDQVYLTTPGHAAHLGRGPATPRWRRSRRATGQEAHGIQADPKWSESGRRRLPPDRRLARDRLGQLERTRRDVVGRRGLRTGRRPDHRRHRRRRPHLRRPRRVRVPRTGARPHRPQPRHRDRRRRYGADVHGRGLRRGQQRPRRRHRLDHVLARPRRLLHAQHVYGDEGRRAQRHGDCRRR